MIAYIHWSSTTPSLIALCRQRAFEPCSRPSRARAPTRRWRERDRPQPAQLRIRGEGMRGQEAKRRGRDAAAPEGAAEPVADFGADPLDVGPAHVADAAGQLAVDLDGEEGLRIHAPGEGDERQRVADPVRVREQVAQSKPDLAIVREPRQIGGIGVPPLPNCGGARATRHRRPDDTTSVRRLHSRAGARPAPERGVNCGDRDRRAPVPGRWRAGARRSRRRCSRPARPAPRHHHHRAWEQAFTLRTGRADRAWQTGGAGNALWSRFTGCALRPRAAREALWSRLTLRPLKPLRSGRSGFTGHAWQSLRPLRSFRSRRSGRALRRGGDRRALPHLHGVDLAAQGPRIRRPGDHQPEHLLPLRGHRRHAGQSGGAELLLRRVVELPGDVIDLPAVGRQVVVAAKQVVVLAVLIVDQLDQERRRRRRRRCVGPEGVRPDLELDPVGRANMPVITDPVELVHVRRGQVDGVTAGERRTGREFGNGLVQASVTVPVNVNVTSCAAAEPAVHRARARAHDERASQSFMLSPRVEQKGGGATIGTLTARLERARPATLVHNGRVGFDHRSRPSCPGGAGRGGRAPPAAARGAANPGAAARPAAPDAERLRLAGLRRDATTLLTRAARPDTAADARRAALRDAADRLRALGAEPAAPGAAILDADLRTALRAAADTVASSPPPRTSAATPRRSSRCSSAPASASKARSRSVSRSRAATASRRSRIRSTAATPPAWVRPRRRQRGGAAPRRRRSHPPSPSRKPRRCR